MSSDDDVSQEVLEMKFKSKTLAEWMEIFKDLDACVSPVLSLDEAPLYKHNVERKSFLKLPDSSYIPSMNWLSGMSPENRSFDMPKIGQHSANILKEIGYSESEISKFLAEKIVEEAKKKKSSVNSKL
jgi:alpha-methylacyl-CoA racemase